MYIVYMEKSNVPLTLKHPLTIVYMMEGLSRLVCKAVDHTGYVLQVRGPTIIFVDLSCLLAKHISKGSKNKSHTGNHIHKQKYKAMKQATQPYKLSTNKTSLGYSRLKKVVWTQPLWVKSTSCTCNYSTTKRQACWGVQRIQEQVLVLLHFNIPSAFCRWHVLPPKKGAQTGGSNMRTETNDTGDYSYKYMSHITLVLYFQKYDIYIKCFSTNSKPSIYQTFCLQQTP